MATQGKLTEINIFPSLSSYDSNKNLVATDSLNLIKTGAAIVETWKSGANWYRKWSDGFIEQGGFLTQNGGSGTVTFNIAFTSVPSIVFQRQVGVCENCLSAVTVSNFSWVSNTSRDGQLHWIASGY